MPSARLRVFVGTRKGLFVLVADSGRKRWSIEGPHFLGQVVNSALVDPRDGRTALAAVKAGHLGPTIYRSTDLGNTWKESRLPPAFPRARSAAARESVNAVFWLTPGHRSEPGTWYAGTTPQALFRSEDGGETWRSVTGFNAHPNRRKWIGDPQASPPDGGTLHSINVDPFDAAHLYVGLSAGGVFESRDRGATWTPLNRGCAADFLPDPEAPFGHDPHCLRVHPRSRDIVYQQNHCGIYRLVRGEDRWERIGASMPREVRTWTGHGSRGAGAWVRLSIVVLDAMQEDGDDSVDRGSLETYVTTRRRDKTLLRNSRSKKSLA
jgi:hypothetical protein